MPKKNYSKTTKMIFDANQIAIWGEIRFYEQVKKKPPFLLSLAIPVPLRVKGEHMKIHNINRCDYSNGEFIIKKITRLNEYEELFFDVIKHSQGFKIIALMGGEIKLKKIGPAQTLVTMTTHYKTHLPGFIFLKPFVNLVIRSLHRFVMNDMKIAIKRECENAHSTEFMA